MKKSYLTFKKECQSDAIEWGRARAAEPKNHVWYDWTAPIPCKSKQSFGEGRKQEMPLLDYLTCEWSEEALTTLDTLLWNLATCFLVSLYTVSQLWSLAIEFVFSSWFVIENRNWIKYVNANWQQLLFDIFSTLLLKNDVNCPKEQRDRRCNSYPRIV